MTGSGKSNQQSGKNLDFDDEARALYERCSSARQNVSSIP